MCRAHPCQPGYHPLVCSMWASSSALTANPFIAPVRPSLSSSNTSGSLYCVAPHPSPQCLILIILQLNALHPVSGPAACVRNGENLNGIGAVFPINEQIWKTTKQESSRTVRAAGPSLRSSGDLAEGAGDRLVESNSRLRAAYQIPLEGSVVVGRCLVVERYRFSGHAAASLDFAGGPPPKGWFSPCRNRGQRCAS